MKAHLGAVLTGGTAVLAIALAALQATVMAHGAPPAQPPTAMRPGPSNRFSAPANRAAVPWAPFDKAEQKPLTPESPEGRTPERRQQEEHHSPPPSRFRGPPRVGPQPIRKIAV
ncbi:MAG TPA: hypothetical protein VMK66_20375 [Myxococcales bacterium]|nr:hypothetical protein [Myxococcales bacterium]